MHEKTTRYTFTSFFITHDWRHLTQIKLKTPIRGLIQNETLSHNSIGIISQFSKIIELKNQVLSLQIIHEQNRSIDYVSNDRIPLSLQHYSYQEEIERKKKLLLWSIYFYVAIASRVVETKILCTSLSPIISSTKKIMINHSSFLQVLHIKITRFLRNSNHPHLLLLSPRPSEGGNDANVISSRQ